MKYFRLMLCGLCLLFQTACSYLYNSEELGKSKNPIFSGDKSLREVKIYFTKSLGEEEIILVPIARKILNEDSIINGALKELFLGPTELEERKSIMTEIPVGTRLIKVEESNDEVLIDLSNQFLIGGGSAAMQLRYLQIYKTLKRVVPKKKLYLYVEGKSIKTIGGEGLEITQPLTMINDYTEKYEKIDEDVQP